MPSHLTSPWNYAVSYLDMLYRDQKLGSGSGLFWKLDDRTFLISNWHNGNRGPSALFNARHGASSSFAHAFHASQLF